MIDETVPALVLKAADFQESDKIVTLFAPANGKFTARVKGVKKDKAKLKFAAEPFCFGEFTLAGKGEMKIVTGCVQSESFFNLTKDIEKYTCGCVVLETLLYAVPENQESGALFVSALKALKALCSDLPPRTVLVKYCLELFDGLGQRLTFDRCASCGSKKAEKYFFDFENGGVVCADCAGAAAFSPDAAVMKLLRVTAENEWGMLANQNDAVTSNTLAFLSRLFELHIHKIKSLNQLLIM